MKNLDNGSTLPNSVIVNPKKQSRIVIKQRVLKTKEELLKRTASEPNSSLIIDASDKKDIRLILRDSENSENHLLNGFRMFRSEKSQGVLVQDGSGRLYPIGEIDELNKVLFLKESNFKIVKPGFIEYLPTVNQSSSGFSFLRKPNFPNLNGSTTAGIVKYKVRNNLNVLTSSGQENSLDLVNVNLSLGKNYVEFLFLDSVGNESEPVVLKIERLDPSASLETVSKSNYSVSNIVTNSTYAYFDVNLNGYSSSNVYSLKKEKNFSFEIVNYTITGSGVMQVVLKSPYSDGFLIDTLKDPNRMNFEYLVVETQTGTNKNYQSYIGISRA